MADDKSLGDVLLLLTKVSSKLGDKVERLEKIVSNNYKQKKVESQESKESKKESKQEETLTALTKMLKLQTDAQQKQPEQVVEKKQEVIISSFGRDASNTLTKAFKGLSLQKKPAEPKKPEEEGMLDKIKKLLPLVGIVLGALSGLVTALMSGKFGELWEAVKAGDWKTAWEKAKSIVYKTVSPILKSLPIIGPILSIRDGIEEFDKGNVIGGLKNVVQGLIGLTPLPFNVKVGIMGAVEFVGAILEKKFGKEQIPKGSGSSIMGVMVKAIEYAFAKLGGKFFFKKIPIIGAIISFYDAYESFKAGGPEGIARGILDICSGIASLFPGVGTAIAIGLDVLNAFLFQKVETQENGRTVTKINMRDWYKKTLDVLADHFPLKNIIKFATGIEYISMGRYKQGFTEIAEAFPILTLLRDLVSNPIEAYKETRAKGGSMADLVNNITESILKSFIDALPDTFGIRYQVAKFLGIKTDAPPPESLKKSETINANLTEAQRKALEEAENLRRQQEEQNAAANAVGTRAMRLGNFGTQPVDDFIKTSDGKIVIPNKEDSLLGFKKDGPLDTLFNKNLKSSQENTDVLKKYADVSSDMLGKQLRLLDENNKLLGALVRNLSKPANVVSSPTVINNNFSNSNSLRNLQGAPA